VLLKQPISTKIQWNWRKTPLTFADVIASIWGGNKEYNTGFYVTVSHGEGLLAPHQTPKLECHLTGCLQKHLQIPSLSGGHLPHSPYFILILKNNQISYQL